jgi:eukaryotic-like serine/threonine-protein kinase
MRKNRWQKIEEIFNQAAALPFAERRRFVEQECGVDADLCGEILRLIESDAEDDDFLKRPVFTLGAKIFDQDSVSLPANSEFASYKIRKLLGRGGMGTVFLAEDMRLNRPVALKILPPALTQNSESVARFQQEARAASNVSHPSVAHIYEFGQFENRYFLAMEYVRGRTLRELVKEKLITRRRAVDIALEIASALQAAHRNGIIHRDIKPENIIVADDGTVKVLDFGLAKLNPALENQSDFSRSIFSLETTPGVIMGTTAYMSPEQIRGQHVDARTDLWSLGVCLYEMIWEKRPFAGETMSDLQAAILRDQILIAESKDKISRQIAVVIGKCLAKNRLQRYETASDLIEDLRRLQSVLSRERGGNAFFKSDWKRRDWFFKAFVPLAIAVALTTTTTTSIPFGRGSLFEYDFFKLGNKTAPDTDAVSKRLNIRSLAVLPFRVVNANSQKKPDNTRLDYLCLGLAEDLARGLGAANAVQIKSFSSARRMRDVTDADEIKKRLQTDAVLRGAIEEIDGRLLLSLELVNTTDGSLLWQDNFEAPAGDSLRLRNALAAVISNNLQTRLETDKRLVLPDYQTGNEAAFQAYLAGKYSPVRTTAEGLRQTIPDLRRAIQLDPNYALARVTLADTYNLLGSWYGERPEVYLPLAKKTLESALRLDPNLSEAHTSLAKIKMDHDRDFAGAETAFRRAIELNPNNALAHHWYGEVFLSAMGRFDESLRELQIAHELNPTSSGVLTALAWTRIGMKDYENAVRECDRALALNPKDSGALSYKAMALMKLNRFEEAIAAARDSAENEGSSVDLGVIYALAGRREEAEKILQNLENKKRTSGDVSDYDLAVIYGALGERHRAFDLLEREANSKSVDLLSIRVDPLLNSLRSDERFKTIERKLNLPN